MTFRPGRAMRFSCSRIPRRRWLAPWEAGGPAPFIAAPGASSRASWRSPRASRPSALVERLGTAAGTANLAELTHFRCGSRPPRADVRRSARCASRPRALRHVPLRRMRPAPQARPASRGRVLKEARCPKSHFSIKKPACGRPRFHGLIVVTGARGRRPYAGIGQRGTRMHIAYPFFPVSEWRVREIPATRLAANFIDLCFFRARSGQCPRS